MSKLRTGDFIDRLRQVERERDEARGVAAKLYSGKPLSPEEHDLARDWLPQSSLEGP